MLLMPFHFFFFFFAFLEDELYISLCFSIHTTGFGSEAWA